MAQNRYPEQKERQRVEPPHASLPAIRIRLGFTQAEVCAEVSRILDRPFTTGALSAIETGLRGASPETLVAIQTALGLRPGDLVVDYEPSHSRRKGAAA